MGDVPARLRAAHAAARIPVLVSASSRPFLGIPGCALPHDRPGLGPAREPGRSAYRCPGRFLLGWPVCAVLPHPALDSVDADAFLQLDNKSHGRKRSASWIEFSRPWTPTADRYSTGAIHDVVCAGLCTGDRRCLPAAEARTERYRAVRVHRCLRRLLSGRTGPVSYT